MVVFLLLEMVICFFVYSIQYVLSQIDNCIQYGEDADVKIKDFDEDEDQDWKSLYDGLIFRNLSLLFCLVLAIMDGIVKNTYIFNEYYDVP